MGLDMSNWTIPAAIDGVKAMRLAESPDDIRETRGNLQKRLRSGGQ